MKKAIIVIGIITMFITCTLILTRATKNDIVLDNVKLKDIEVKKGLAIMVEQSDGTYTESNTYPTGNYMLRENKSGCMDKNGKSIPNSVSYKNGTLSFKTNSSSYCYVYLDKQTIINYLLVEDTRPSSLWTSTLDDDGYRFVGTDPNNYICFGTTDKDTCIGNTDLYMYRIIGIFKDSAGNNHLKLIKKETLNESYQWSKSPSYNYLWTYSLLYDGINESYFLSNTTYSYMQNTKWTDMITDWTWKAVSTKTYDYRKVSAEQVYYHEMNHTNKSSDATGEWEFPSAKIGLMYVSDYMMSLGESALSYTGQDDSLITGWMHLSNNDTAELSTTGIAPLNSSEYTMAHNNYIYASSFSSYYNFAYLVEADGVMATISTNGSASIRPVFYLNTDVLISSGTGTSTDPYIIS